MNAVARIRIAATGPFDHVAAFGTLAMHAVYGLHQLKADAAQLTRRVDVFGDSHQIWVRLDPGGVLLLTPTRDQAVNEEIASRVRHWFDLDTDLAPVNAHLLRDPMFCEQVRSRPGIRITRFQAPFEAAVLTVLGQQVSLAAARLFAGRLVTSFGTAPARSHQESGLRDFPSPVALAAIPPDQLRAAIGLTRNRARTVSEVAAFFAGADDGEWVPSQLHTVYGIGPWTLDYLAIRADTDADAFPVTDAVLRRTLAANAPDADAARIASWSPYRSYAASRLWAQNL